MATTPKAARFETSRSSGRVSRPATTLCFGGPRRAWVLTMTDNLNGLLQEFGRMRLRVARAVAREFPIGSRWYYRDSHFRSVQGPAEVIGHGPDEQTLTVVLVADLERCRANGREPGYAERCRTQPGQLSPLPGKPPSKEQS